MPGDWQGQFNSYQEYTFTENEMIYVGYDKNEKLKISKFHYNYSNGAIHITSSNGVVSNEIEVVDENKLIMKVKVTYHNKGGVEESHQNIEMFRILDDVNTISNLDYSSWLNKPESISVFQPVFDQRKAVFSP